VRQDAGSSEREWIRASEIREGRRGMGTGDAVEGERGRLDIKVSHLVRIRGRLLMGSREVSEK
jgi:hypothetical protein